MMVVLKNVRSSHPLFFPCFDRSEVQITVRGSVGSQEWELTLFGYLHCSVNGSTEGT